MWHFSIIYKTLSECNKLRIKKEAEEGNKAAKRAQNLIENYSKSISTILIGNNLVNIAASSFTTVFPCFSIGAKYNPRPYGCLRNTCKSSRKGCHPHQRYSPGALYPRTYENTHR